MKPIHILALIGFISLVSCTKTTNRGIEIEYRTDTVFASRDTTFVMDTANWVAFSNINQFVDPGPTTYFKTLEGIKILFQQTYNGLRLQTKEEFSFRDKTIYYKWKINGFGDYAAAIPAVKYNPHAGDGYYAANQGVYLDVFSTKFTQFGSTLISDDVWFYTRVKHVIGSDNFQIITASDNYDNAGGRVIRITTLPIYTKSGFISFMLYDPFHPNAYGVLAECKVIKD